MPHYQMDGSSLGPVLKPASLRPLLTAPEEMQLAKEVAGGGEAGKTARDRLFESNIRLVGAIVRSYAGRGVSEDDLIQEGCIGLTKAIEKFDPARGYRFSTVAFWWVRQAVARAVADQGRIIRRPVHVSTMVGKIGRAYGVCVQRFEREPTDDELASVAGLTRSQLGLVLSSPAEPLSLDSVVVNGEESSGLFVDLLANDSEDIGREAEANQRREAIDRLLSELDEREAFVLRMRYGLEDGIEHSLVEIGVKLRLSRERVRQIEMRAIGKLRKPGRLKLAREWAN